MATIYSKRALTEEAKAKHLGGRVKVENRSANFNGRVEDVLNRQHKRAISVEGYDNADNTCNNSNVNPDFQISHDNSVHNCNSEDVYLNYSSAPHIKTTYVPTPREFTLPASNLSNITPALFDSGARECNNNVNVKDQQLELGYTIEHDKSKIVIEQLGSGMLEYGYNNSGSHSYNLSEMSSDVNKQNIRIEDNGNVMMNDIVIFNNPINMLAKNVVSNYNSNNKVKKLKVGEEIKSARYRLKLGSSWNNSMLFYKTTNARGNIGVRDLHGNTFKYTEHYHKNNGSATENVFILYKIKSYDLSELLYDNLIYANIEKTDILDCSKESCYVRAIAEKLVGDIKLDENNNVNLRTVPSITMNKFKTNPSYKLKYINNDILQNVPDNINEIRIFLIKSLTDIHMKIAKAMNSGASEGFKGYDNKEFSRYSTIEGLSYTTDGGVVADGNDGDGIKNRLNLLTKMGNMNAGIKVKTDDMKTNADDIRNKLQKLTGYDHTNTISIHNTSISGGNTYDTSKGDLHIHNEYDDANTLIPFIFDNGATATDYYRKRGDDGKPDKRAKIDAIKEDLNAMLYQQNALYTIGSITSVTFIITALLLARNSSS